MVEYIRNQLKVTTESMNILEIYYLANVVPCALLSEFKVPDGIPNWQILSQILCSCILADFKPRVGDALVRPKKKKKKDPETAIEA